MSNPPLSLLKTVFLPGVILVLAFFSRFFYISLGPYHLDCLTLAIKSTETIQTHHLQYLFGSGYPLVVGLGACFVFVYKLFGGVDPVIAVNFMSVVFGTLGAWMFFLVIRKVDSEIAALWSSLLFCVSPILWGTSVYGMSHSPSLFFLLLSLYFLFSYLENTQQKYLIFGAVALGLMGSARLQDMILMAPPVSYLLLSNKEGGMNLKYLKQQAGAWFRFFFVAFFIVGLFHLPYLLDGAQGQYNHQWKGYWYLGLSSNFRGLLSEYFWLSMTFLKTNYTVLGLLLAVPGWFLLFFSKRKLAIFIAFWFGIYLFFIGNLATVVPRFFVVMIPSLIFCQTVILVEMFNRHVLMQWVSVGILIVLMVMQTFVILPGIMYRHGTSAIKDFSIWVGNVTEDNARIIAGDEFAFITYYGRRIAQTRPSCSVTCPANELESFRQNVEEWIKAAIPVYMTNTALLADNPNGEFKTFIDKHYNLQYVGEHLMEDWHQDGFKFRVGYEKLFRLEPKVKK